MEISVDISMYPLQEAYEKPILAFISSLENVDKVEVVRNELSTQIHGEFRTIMALLEKEMFSVFTEIPHSVFVLKFLGNNRRGKLGV